MPLPRFTLCAWLSVFSLGCMTRNTVSADAIAQLSVHSSEGGVDEILVAGIFGQRARIDPNANLRISDGNGNWSPLLDADALRSDGQSIYSSHRMPFDQIVEIQADHLGPKEIDVLRFSRPAEGQLMIPPGGRITMMAPPKLVQLWLREYLRTLQDELSERNCSPASETGQASAHCSKSVLDLVPKGRWTMLHKGGSSEPLTTSQLPDALENGVQVFAGWDVRSIRSVEVHHISGARTLLGFLAVPSLLTGGLQLAGHLAKAGLEDPRPYLPPSQFATRDSVKPVFSSSFRRRSAVQATTHLRTQLGHKGSIQTSDLAVGARFLQIVDLRLGVSLALKWDYQRPSASLPGPKSSTRRTPLHGYYVTGGLGISAPLDAAKKFTIPIGVDLGGGSGFFARFSAGLRVRLTDSLHLGLYALNPTRVSFAPSANPGTETYWTFQSGADLEFSF